MIEQDSLYLQEQATKLRNVEITSCFAEASANAWVPTEDTFEFLMNDQFRFGLIICLRSLREDLGLPKDLA